MKIIILNGPNLNLLGVREKSVYGSRSFEDYYEELKEAFRRWSCPIFSRTPRVR